MESQHTHSTGEHPPGAHRAPGAHTRAAVQRTDLRIEGMSCASCAARIEKRLAKQPGVESASVNFATKVATVSHDPAVVSPQGLAGAIREGNTAMINSIMRMWRRYSSR